MSRKIIKFTKAHDKYIKGDVAGFADDVARKLIDQKFAVPHSAEKEKASAKAALTGEQAKELQSREDDLAKREKALEAREAKLKKKEDAGAAGKPPKTGASK